MKFCSILILVTSVHLTGSYIISLHFCHLDFSIHDILQLIFIIFFRNTIIFINKSKRSELSRSLGLQKNDYTVMPDPGLIDATEVTKNL